MITATGGSCGNNVPFDGQERLFISRMITYVNQVVEAAAREAGVVYVDVEHALDGHALCSGADAEDVYVNGITAGNDTDPDIIGGLLGIQLPVGVCIVKCLGGESFHPKADAHVLYADTIRSQTASLTTPMPDPVDTPVPLPDAFFGILAELEVARLNNPATHPSVQLINDEALIRGADYYQGTINLFLQGYKPGTDVSVTLHSDPVSLGEFTVRGGRNDRCYSKLPKYYSGRCTRGARNWVDQFGAPIERSQSILFAQSADDFDGDGVLDEDDTCQGVVNSGFDIDEDGLDDACDTSRTIVVVDPPEPSQPPQKKTVQCAKRFVSVQLKKFECVRGMCSRAKRHSKRN